MIAKDTVATLSAGATATRRQKDERVVKPLPRRLNLDVEPLTSQRWTDFVALFESRGCSVARGCWCMFYRESGRTVVPPGRSLRDARMRSMKRLVDRGIVSGLLGYHEGLPVGWVSLGPREQYARLVTSRVMKAVDDKPVWSIVCFVVAGHMRRRGVAAAMLKGALAWARKKGVTLVEAYPVDTEERSGDDAMWFGAKSMYDDAGFVEVARRKPTRPVVRKKLRARPPIGR